MNPVEDAAGDCNWLPKASKGSPSGPTHVRGGVRDPGIRGICGGLADKTRDPYEHEAEVRHGMDHDAQNSWQGSR